ncbi:MAG: type II toxin-antitoxin system Phd/YefM family antitoxin [Phycisphaerae bacterium]
MEGKFRKKQGGRKGLPEAKDSGLAGEPARFGGGRPLKRWQLQEAKAKFSEVFDRAVKEGPQVVTRRNKEAVVILPEAEFRKLTQMPRGGEPNLLAVLLQCPKGPDLEIHRDEGTVLDLPPVFE